MSQVQEYIVEILQENPAAISPTPGSTYEFEVEISNSTLVGHPAVPEIIEVAIVPPVGAGIRQIESIPFTRQGQLTTIVAGTEYPIGGGQFVIDSITARVATPPTGSAIILDVLKNDVSIFSNPANRPTIAADQQIATVGDFDVVMLADGDYLEVIIAQVGSTFSGASLVAAIRTERIA